MFMRKEPVHVRRLDATQRNVYPDEVQWRRGMAWAFEQAMGSFGTTRSVIRW